MDSQALYKEKGAVARVELTCILQAIYIAGSPFINQPWGADSYSVRLNFVMVVNTEVVGNHLHRDAGDVGIDAFRVSIPDLQGWKSCRITTG